MSGLWWVDRWDVRDVADMTAICQRHGIEPTPEVLDLLLLKLLTAPTNGRSGD